MSGEENALKKHSIIIAGHQTSITLENIFWYNLKKIAKMQSISLNALITDIDSTRQTNLSSAIRVFVLKKHLRD